MSRLPPFDIRGAHWDRMRDAVVIPAGRDHVVVTLDALEAHTNRTLSPEDAVEAAGDDAALLRVVANATGAQDGVITITRARLNGRDWSAAPYEGEPEDSGAIYAPEGH